MTYRLFWHYWKGRLSLQGVKRVGVRDEVPDSRLMTHGKTGSDPLVGLFYLRLNRREGQDDRRLFLDLRNSPSHYSEDLLDTVRVLGPVCLELYRHC